MTKQTKIFATVLVLVLAMVLYLVIAGPSKSEAPVIGGDRDEHDCIGSAGYSWCEERQACIRPWEEYCTKTVPKVAIFNCDGAKTVTAVFYPGDDKYVDLVLSDQRKLSVPRAMSASGARYANADESFVFWNKGDTAFITESGTTTFSGCGSED